MDKIKTEKIKLPLKMKKSDLLLLLLILLSFVPGLVLYGQLPERMPSHWNVYGQVDGYSSKAFATLFFPGLNLGMYFLFLVLPRLDPKRKNYALFTSSYNVVRWAIHVFLILIYLVIVVSALRLTQGQPTLDVSRLVPIGVSVLFIILGNYMGRFRHNYFIGIRNPWTLANEQVWQKTHRLGGKLFVLVGVLGIISVFLNPMLRFGLFMGGVVALLVVTTVYSYWIYRKIVQ
ncbi:MAG: SdpI family protein [Desulfitobacteriaceae bacterium]|nr:SdpI family protein [Desulfitobacteriaceae bacterium]MDI6915488.1 SdpI family protein [Desulfitobacteriaceae bacterium]